MLPNTQAPTNIIDLAGAIVWIILRLKDGDILFSHIYVTQIEQFEDGLDVGNFLLLVDQSMSYRLISDLVHSNKKYLSTTRAFQLGISEIEVLTTENIEQEVFKRISTNFRKPSDNLLKKIILPTLPVDTELQARRAIASVSAVFSLEELWAARHPAELSPFAYFAYLKIKAVYGDVIADNLIDKLKYFDPVSSKGIKKEATNAHGIDEKDFHDLKVPSVDIELTEIDLDRLYARRFIARAKLLSGLEDKLKKTERAEKYHQDILRDVVSFLKSCSITPLQSTSIDLLIEIKNKAFLFEIKSAHPQNILSQAAKAVFQLTCYRVALKDDGRDVTANTLILQKIGQFETEQYVTKILNDLNIKVFFYDINKDWPARVEGLLNFINRY